MSSPIDRSLSLHNVGESRELQLYSGDPTSSVKESQERQFDYTQKPAVKSLVLRFEAGSRKVETGSTAKTEGRSVPSVSLSKVDQLAKDGKWAAVWKNFSHQDTGYFIKSKIVGTLIAIINFLLSPLFRLFTGHSGSFMEFMAPKPTPLQLKLDEKHREQTLKKLETINEAAELYAGLHDEAPSKAKGAKDVGAVEAPDTFSQAIKEIKGYKNIGRLLVNPKLLEDIDSLPKELREIQPKLLSLSKAFKESGLQLDKNGEITNPDSGFKATLHWNEKSKTLHLVIVGSSTEPRKEPKRFWATWITNLNQGLGGMPQSFRDADFVTYMICNQLGSEYTKKHFVISGHSKGGGEASYATGKNCANIQQGIAFNPSSVNAFAVKRYGLDSEEVRKKLTTVTVEGEVVHDWLEKPGHRLNAVWHLGKELKLKVPEHAPDEGVGIFASSDTGKKLYHVPGLKPVLDTIDHHNMKPVTFAMKDILAKAQQGEISPMIAVA